MVGMDATRVGIAMEVDIHMDTSKRDARSSAWFVVNGVMCHDTAHEANEMKKNRRTAVAFKEV